MRTGSSRKLLNFVMVLASLLITLAVLNRLPLVFQKGVLKRYPSIEAVRSKLNLKELAVPAYFPQYISWPPAEIWAQTTPYVATLIVFNRAGTGQPVLVLSQAASGRSALDAPITIHQIKEKVPYTLHGKQTLLEVGTCKDKEVCSRISWNEGLYSMALIMKSQPFDLIQIAESEMQ